MKLTKIIILRYGAIGLLLGGVFACAIGFISRDNVPITTINQLQKDRDTDATVYLKGKVVKQVPFLGTRAYELQDSTGIILVITNEKFPKKKEVLIKGKVQYKSIPLGGRDLGEVYVKEQERL